MKNSNEFDKFDQTMRTLMKVPHSELKAKLDAEKASKAGKRRRRKLKKVVPRD